MTKHLLLEMIDAELDKDFDTMGMNPTDDEIITYNDKALKRLSEAGLTLEEYQDYLISMINAEN